MGAIRTVRIDLQIDRTKFPAYAIIFTLYFAVIA